MFIPKRKPTSQILLQVVGYQPWAQLGSGPRPAVKKMSGGHF